MINKNYLIIAHDKPKQLSRLINKLNDLNTWFFIHLDKKCDIDQFSSEIEASNIIFIKKRIDCIWGDFTQVQAILNSLEEVLENNNYQFTILLSGSDYPVKSKEEINNYLQKNEEYNFMDVKPVEMAWSSYKLRTEKYKFNYSSRRNNFNEYSYLFEMSQKEFTKTIKDLIKKKIQYRDFITLLQKRKPVIQKQYGGSSWWAFNYKTLVKVMSYVKANRKDLESYYKYSTCADEIYFQTILKFLEETDPDIKIKDSLTYANWTRENCTLPVTFNDSDMYELSHQPLHLLFARKFDMDYSYEILDMIDEYHKVNHEFINESFNYAVSGKVAEV